jgi:ABC-type multidrug transport system fused ATPase/permease subunit
MASVERIIELMDMPVEEGGEPVRLDGEVGISFSNVTFAYPGGSRRVLNGFTHDFRPATLTALVGETGVGKSTLMRLVLALLTPDSGEIRIYNGEKSVVASPRTRCNLVYVPQGNTLMSGTLRENLQLGKPDATDEEMRHALHVAVADFVMSLPDGLDSRCGEGGVGLSEGQAQRIAIARGLLRPGSILLLDEPTSSLDSETEQILLSRMAAEVHRRTVIVVTHREHVVELCQERCYMTRS